jgi:release factor glutamine methyltransferase
MEPVTVLEVIQRSTEFLQQKGVESARLQIELMLARILNIPRLKLYLNFDRKLTEPEISQAREMVRRRASREPLQHILGSVSFCGLEIRCDRAALIPRPETELLAERAWQFMSSRPPGESTCLDLGTGTGCIAIAVAVHAPQAVIHAVEISAEQRLRRGEQDRIAARIDGHPHLRNLLFLSTAATSASRAAASAATAGKGPHQVFDA